MRDPATLTEHELDMQASQDRIIKLVAALHWARNEMVKLMDAEADEEDCVRCLKNISHLIGEP